jgi:hypothetical protein
MSDPSVAQVPADMQLPPAGARPRGHSLLDLLDRPIAFHRIYATLTGSATAGLMLSQAVYWTRVKLHTEPGSDGWFYKTREEWEEETALSRSEQEIARRTLRRLPFYQEKRAGLPAKLYFRIDLDTLAEALLPLPPPRPKRGQKPQQNRQNAESCKLDGPEPTIKKVGNQPTITETTSETTPEKQPNVGNVGTDHTQTKRRLRLSARQEELVEVLEEQFEDTHSRGAFCRIVSDTGLGEDVAARLLRETLEQEHVITGPLGAYYIAACQREAQRQRIDLGFTRTTRIQETTRCAVIS